VFPMVSETLWRSPKFEKVFFHRKVARVTRQALVITGIGMLCVTGLVAATSAFEADRQAESKDDRSERYHLDVIETGVWRLKQASNR